MADKHSNTKRVRVAAHVRRIRPRRAYHYPKVDVRLKQDLLDGVNAYCRARNMKRSALVRSAIEAMVPPIYLKRRGALLASGEGAK